MELVLYATSKQTWNSGPDIFVGFLPLTWISDSVLYNRQNVMADGTAGTVQCNKDRNGQVKVRNWVRFVDFYSVNKHKM